MKHIAAMIFFVLLLTACAPSAEQIATPLAATLAAGLTATSSASQDEPTDTVVPTLTSTITHTPAPTNTPKPTKTPKPTNTATPAPEPITYTGTGDSIIDVERSWEGPSLVELNYTGAHNFIVKNIDENNEMIDGLANAIGEYSGRTFIDAFKDENTRRISVESSGPWTITIYPLDTQYFHSCVVPGTCEGIGDDVIYLDGNADTLQASYSGEHNFIVTSYGTSYDGLINEIGQYNGTVLVPKGANFIKVIASGPWTFDITSR
jgi:hypothetical protein